MWVRLFCETKTRGLALWRFPKKFLTVSEVPTLVWHGAVMEDHHFWHISSWNSSKKTKIQNWYCSSILVRIDSRASRHRVYKNSVLAMPKDYNNDFTYVRFFFRGNIVWRNAVESWDFFLLDNILIFGLGFKIVELDSLPQYKLRQESLASLQNISGSCLEFVQPTHTDLRIPKPFYSYIHRYRLIV